MVNWETALERLLCLDSPPQGPVQKQPVSDPNQIHTKVHYNLNVKRILKEQEKHSMLYKR